MFGLRGKGRKKGGERPKSKGEEWDREELEFLPAALEIVESPPSPSAEIGRASCRERV